MSKSKARSTLKTKVNIVSLTKKLLYESQYKNYKKKTIIIIIIIYFLIY